MNFESGYLLCLECNAKNRMGGYIGKQRMSLLIRNEVVIAQHDNDRFCYNHPFSYYVWPEMEMAGEK